MSYILHGSGAVLSPCLAHLVTRDLLAKFSPCICLKCSRLISSSSVHDRGKFPAVVQPDPKLPQYQSVSGSKPSVMRREASHGPSPSVRSTYVSPGPSPSVRSTYTSPIFRESHTGSYQVPGSSLNINLTVRVGPDLNTGVTYRLLHTSSLLGQKASSKLEETVIRLKEKQEEALDETLAEISKVEDLEKKVATVMEQDEMAVKRQAEDAKLEVPKKSIWEKVVAEAKHYYSGFKLLFLDVKLASQIVWKIAQGKTLSRRENRQLVRTVSDLFRLVPFSVFIIVPFMELLLPVALKLFPGMLPSTFASENERENKMRRQLKAKLEYAKFLGKTLDEMEPADKVHRSQSAADFVKFYKSVKNTGDITKQVTNKDILKFSKLFEDEITLDNMTRGQLVAICRLLELTPIGTNAFLRFQIEMQLRKLKADDVIIAKEGVEQMTVKELQTACKDRGMRALGMTKDKLVQQLRQWIELSTNEKVPPSLLLLSRTLYLPEDLAPEKVIEASISALPETVATGAKAKIGEREGKIENVTRLEVLKQEQAKIEEEEKEAKFRIEEKMKKEEEKRLKQEKLVDAGMAQAREEQSLGVLPPPPTAEAVVKEATSILRRATVDQDGVVSGEVVVTVPAESLDDIHVTHAEVIQESVPSTTHKKSAVAQELSAKDLTALKSAIETISREKNPLMDEHEVMQELRQELTDYEEDLAEIKEVAESTGREHLRQTKGAARLFGMVNRVLSRADSVVKKLETRETEMKEDLDSLGKESSEDPEELITIQDLLVAVRELQNVPDSEMLERISEVIASIDEDSDGIIKMEHVNKVIEILGRDNVEASGKQVKQIIDLIVKEELLEVESRIEKILGKIPAIDVKPVETVIDQDLTEKAGEAEIVDTATDLTEGDVEPHIVEMFSRDDVAGGKEKEKTDVSKQDNTIKDVTDSVKDKEEEPVKVPQKNGSRK